MALRRPWLTVALFGGSGLLVVLTIAGAWFMRFGHERMPGVVIRFSPFVDQVSRAYMVLQAKSWSMDGVFFAHHFPLERYTRLVGPLTAESFRAALHVGLRAAGSDTYPSDPEAVATIRRWVHDERWWIRLWWMTLVGPENPELRQCMVDLVDDPHPAVAVTAVSRLGRGEPDGTDRDARIIEALVRAMKYQTASESTIMTTYTITALYTTVVPAGNLINELVAMTGFQESILTDEGIATMSGEVRIAAFHTLMEWDGDLADQLAVDHWDAWTSEQQTGVLQRAQYSPKPPLRLIAAIAPMANPKQIDAIFAVLLRRATRRCPSALVTPLPRLDEVNASDIHPEVLSCWGTLSELLDQPQFAVRWSAAVTRHLGTSGNSDMRARLKAIPRTIARKLVLALEDEVRRSFDDIVTEVSSAD